MKIKFTAEIIDDDGNVVGKRTSEEGGIPSMETFDISTREGFLRDFDLLEKAVLKARNRIGADAADEILKGTLKKQRILEPGKRDSCRVRTGQNPRLSHG
jgi:hypothetical protein